MDLQLTPIMATFLISRDMGITNLARGLPRGTAVMRNSRAVVVEPGTNPGVRRAEHESAGNTDGEGGPLFSGNIAFLLPVYKAAGARARTIIRVAKSDRKEKDSGCDGSRLHSPMARILSLCGHITRGDTIGMVWHTLAGRYWAAEIRLIRSTFPGTSSEDSYTSFAYIGEDADCGNSQPAAGYLVL